MQPDVMEMIDTQIAQTSGPLEMVNELVDQHGLSRGTAYRIIGAAMEIGAASAPYRRETADKVAEIQIERQHRRVGC